MRVCGRCLFTAADTNFQPYAALVIAFSSTRMQGAGGILEQIENMSAIKHLPMASAYCCVCRRCTWLCNADADLNNACLEFLQNSNTTESIESALKIMHKNLKP